MSLSNGGRLSKCPNKMVYFAALDLKEYLRRYADLNDWLRLDIIAEIAPVAYLPTYVSL